VATPNHITPALNFVKKETFGYSMNGHKFLVPQGSSYTTVADGITAGTSYGETYSGTTAQILSGSNNSTRRDGSSITEIANHLSLPKNSVFRIVRTLAASGYLDEYGKSWRLSPKILSLGYTAVQSTYLIGACMDEMRTLRDEINETIFVGAFSEGKIVIHANTPSFIGSHVTGFSNMTMAMVNYLSEKTGATLNQVNIIPGFVEPADMREVKRLATLMGVETICFPDTSNVLDAPQTGKHQFYPNGGVTTGELARTAESQATICLGPTASEPAAKALDGKFGFAPTARGAEG